MYNYVLINNHYIVNIENKYYILDTGSPFSYSFVNGLDKVFIDGVEHKLGIPRARFSVTKTYDLVGFPVDGLLGSDAFGKTGFTIYKQNKEGGLIDFKINKICLSGICR